jgi:hypothetical protein
MEGVVWVGDQAKVDVFDLPDVHIICMAPEGYRKPPNEARCLDCDNSQANVRMATSSGLQPPPLYRVDHFLKFFQSMARWGVFPHPVECESGVRLFRKIARDRTSPDFLLVCGNAAAGAPLACSFSFDPPYPNIQIDQQPNLIFLSLNRVTSVIEENIRGISRHYHPNTLLV